MALDKKIMDFVVGSIHRERERIARVLSNSGYPIGLIEGILDESQDPNVFRHNGPDVRLDDPPTPYEP
jgi:hypothetical protein